jgi:hypothetical protein
MPKDARGPLSTICCSDHRKGWVGGWTMEVAAAAAAGSGVI